ncbi:hypothetical protein LIER_25753 [Lithospermum erythrorhizon]|uniref:Gag-pol polyprotein n=1 Tax=Lithospermum erythrorhizon TaxID=34254 RepID=A0AAV3R9B0_LITER
MSLDDEEPCKKKGIALIATSKDLDNEDLVETVNLLAKNINKSLKRFNKKPYGGTSYPSVNNKGNNIWNKPVKQENFNLHQQDKSKGIQCREFEGFGHIQVECPNYIKKPSKNYYTTLTDDDLEEEDDQEEKVSNFVACATQIEPPVDDSLHDNSEDEDEMTEEYFLENGMN